MRALSSGGDIAEAIKEFSGNGMSKNKVRAWFSGSFVDYVLCSMPGCETTSDKRGGGEAGRGESTEIWSLRR